MKYSAKRWKELAGIDKTKKSSPPGGADDSVDGPYTELSKLQPLEEQSTLSEEQASTGSEGYPETAQEYAEEVNSLRDGAFRLVSDQEYWEKMGIRTGKDLAKYLAQSAYSDTYKDAYGIRPRTNTDKYSIEDLDRMTDELSSEMSYNDYYEYEDEEDDEYPVDFANTERVEEEDKPEKYEDYEETEDRKHFGRSF